jgi:competence protein ComEA
MKKGLFIVPVVIVIGLFLFITRDDGAANNEAELQEVLSTAGDGPEEGNPSLETELMVDVKGEVRNPGVYEMTADSRVNDVIQKAGGLTDEADETQVNLAQKVHDEMIIIISKTGEGGGTAGTGGGIDDAGKVRINVADQGEIETLNGIGPSKAAAIIQYREENGLFQTVEDLLEISGVGQKTLDNIKDDLIIP